MCNYVVNSKNILFIIFLYSVVYQSPNTIFINVDYKNPKRNRKYKKQHESIFKI